MSSCDYCYGHLDGPHVVGCPRSIPSPRNQVKESQAATGVSGVIECPHCKLWFSQEPSAAVEVSDEELDVLSTRRAHNQSSTGNEILNNAVQWYIKIGFEDGYRACEKARK